MPRSARFRTRTPRPVSNDTPGSLNVTESVQLESAEPSEDEESQWEDVSDPQNEAQTLYKPLRGDSAKRKRKRIRSGLTPTDKLSASGVATSSDMDTKREKPPQPEALAQHERDFPTPALRERAQNVPDLMNGVTRGVSFGGWYIFDVCRTALALLRYPLGILLFLCIFAMALLKISHILRDAFAPICWLPLISSTLMCQPTMTAPLSTVNYPMLMDVETKTFEQLLDEASGGSALSLEVKKAEMATSDLVTLVHLSSLTSKEALARMLLDFVEDAKKTGRRLQKLHAKVGGSVDT